MVRTKADGACRVAAGGKAPKKSLSKPQSSPSPGSGEKGKDHLPGNRYCPRETPTWQKKITFFTNETKKPVGNGSSEQSDGDKTNKNMGTNIANRAEEKEGPLKGKIEPNVNDSKVVATENSNEDDFEEMEID